MNTQLIEHSGARCRAATAARDRGAFVASVDARRAIAPATAADAPALHALIDAHSKKAGCCRGRSTSSTIHAPRFVVSANRSPRASTDRRLRGAGAAQRHAWPKFARWSSIAPRASLGIGRRLVDRAAAPRRARRLRAAVRVHPRRRLLRAQRILHRPARRGCRRRSRATAIAARSSAAAASTRSCCRWRSKRMRTRCPVVGAAR